MSNTPSAQVSDAAPTTAKWTRFLPEAFGIRENVQNSPFRWCVRESFLWGIGTGTAMGFHRLRMNSHPFFAINVAFATSLLVTVPSYYFCYRRREHKEETIELMMKANDFAHEEQMPERIPDEEHPFLHETNIDISNNNNNNNNTVGGMQKEFFANLKERKEWQKAPSEQERDPANIFKEVPTHKK
mmetsp:Transcript_15210/g.21698  ORF Transcript_15210/g.21698 Transcript_15210/m.21698 type:complete len:186 (-) Transcript_15210:36-593(-)